MPKEFKDRISIGIPRILDPTTGEAEILCGVESENEKMLFRVRLDKDPAAPGRFRIGGKGLINQVRAQLSTYRAGPAVVGRKNSRALEEGHETQSKKYLARRQKVREKFAEIHSEGKALPYAEIVRMIKDWSANGIIGVERSAARLRVESMPVDASDPDRLDGIRRLLDKIEGGQKQLSESAIRRYTKDLAF